MTLTEKIEKFKEENEQKIKEYQTKQEELKTILVNVMIELERAYEVSDDKRILKAMSILDDLM